MIKLYEEFSKETEILEEYYDNGKISRREYVIDKKFIKKNIFVRSRENSKIDNNKILHREDGPALETWYKDGQKEYEIWYLYGKEHREDGPAIYWWDKEDNTTFKAWYINGLEHREDGPAKIWYGNGKIERERYLFGEYIDKKDWLYELEKIESPHYKKQLMLYNVKKYKGNYHNNYEYSREEWVDFLKEIDSPYYEEQKMLLNMEKYNL